MPLSYDMLKCRFSLKGGDLRTKHIAILFSGNGSNMENLYRTLHNRDFGDTHIEIPLSIASRERAFGIKRCENLGLKCAILPSRDYGEYYDEALLDTLGKYPIDLVVLAGFMKVLGERFLARYTTINIHPSILPLFKGANGIVESYQSDMKIAGVSVHFVTSELDSGALIAQDIIHKIEGESLADFEVRIHALEHRIYPQAVLKVLGCE